MSPASGTVTALSESAPKTLQSIGGLSWISRLLYPAPRPDHVGSFQEAREVRSREAKATPSALVEKAARGAAA